MAKKQLSRLEQYTVEIADVQRKITSTVQRGLKSPDDRVQRFCAIRGRELLHELATLTWDATALKMELAKELPHAGTTASYFYAAELRQWAKVHMLDEWNYQMEAITAEHHGVLAIVPRFQFLDQWIPSTATEYRAMLAHLLSTGGITWNQTIAFETLTEPEARSSVPSA